MGLLHRKLFSLDKDYCENFCNDRESCSSDQTCKYCFNKCGSLRNDDLQPPTYKDDGNLRHHSIVPNYLIITFSVVAAAFFVLCCYAIYVKFFRSRRRPPSSSSQQEQETRDEFLDEEHGPMVDHPIWYIRTQGLHQSIISAITVCKYKRGEGLIEGTECSVCLGEFEEDERLRLLPKCNHAFHLPCIDTWLRSHTNCPLCRAPIVTNPAASRIPSMDPNAAVDSSSLEDGATQMEETEEVEVEEGEGSASQEVANVRPRRSVSLDSSSAAKISAALATVGGSMRKIGEGANEVVGSKRVVAVKGAGSSSSSRSSHLQSAPCSMKRSLSFNGKHLMSWYSRSSQKKPSAPPRSF